MHRLCIMYAMDPRGSKVGGIETHIRLLLKHHPADFRLLFVGLDERGDLGLGRVAPLTIEGREVDFLPVAHVPAERVNRAATTLIRSTTLAYVLGLVRALPAVRRWTAQGPASIDLHRFEFALPARLLGLPQAQMVHGEGGKGDQMDSLIKRYWFLHRFNEAAALRLADRIFCVNPSIMRRLERDVPQAALKAELMTVSVDTHTFSLRPFDCADGVLRIGFAGRLDAFKDPPLMFRTIAALRERLGGDGVEFHYAGATDPRRYAEFASIEACAILHGVQPAKAVAEILGRCHAGILTSHFEGLPCFLLETMAVGRPIGAVRLPQYDAFIATGTSGRMVERDPDPKVTANALAEAFEALWADIRSGRISPGRVRTKVEAHSVDTQMVRLFERHRTMQSIEQSKALSAPPSRAQG